MARLMLVRLKHVHRFRDRHGTVRHYLRIPGRKAIALPGEPGSQPFLAAYHAAMQTPAPTPQVAAGTLNALAVSYYASPAFLDLRASSQANYRRIIERLREAHGTKPVRLLDGQGVRRILAERAAHPAAANHLLRILRLLSAHGLETGQLATDPTTGVKRRAYEVQGYRQWTEDEIAAYERRWPSGTKQRLALALLLCTGQRRSDVVRLGPLNVRGGKLHFQQVKTLARLELPILPALAAELAHVPAGQGAFLVREDGKTPHTAGGFYNLFVSWCAEAGLEPGLAPHGLRKASARRHAENGATVSELMAWHGWKSMNEAALYTAAADQAHLAERAMAKVLPFKATRRKKKSA
jgi:integrase